MLQKKRKREKKKGCAGSKPDIVDPPYVREAGSVEDRHMLGPPKESPATKITCLQCYICGKQFQNNKVSIDAHYEVCDEVHQTPPDWDKYGVIYHPNLKRRCKSF